jgi:protein-disulfide isomerase
VDFPIESIHKDALKAHEAANCAGDQGKYWAMHDRLFANQNALAPEHLPRYAAAVGLNVSVFEQCLSSRKHEAGIRQSIQAAVNAGVRGTPMFFLGFTNPDDSNVTTIEMIRGAQPYPAFKQAIDKLLAAQGK